MTGYGTPRDIDITPAEKLEGEDANLIMKAAQHNFRRHTHTHTPKGYRKGFRRFTKKGKQFKSQGKGKEKVAKVERDFDVVFSIVNSRTVAKVRVTVAKRILLENVGNP